MQKSVRVAESANARSDGTCEYWLPRALLSSGGCRPDVHQYRLLHAEFGTRAHPQPPATDTSLATPNATSESLAMPICGQCHLPRKRLHRSGICRGCKADMDLAAQVRAVRAELGPGAPRPSR
jgi:hypothetical protein